MEYGFLFPPFGIPYLGTEYDILSNLSIDFEYWISRARKIFNIDMHLFTHFRDGTFQDELQSQYSTYIYSCAMSHALKRHNINTSFSAGFSMGIYAALYHAEALSFEDGLRLIEIAYKLAYKKVCHSRFAMGTIVGLDEKNVRTLVSNYNDVEVCGINNPYCYVISGIHNNVIHALEFAQRKGALSTRLMPASIPYHSRFMADAAIEFTHILKQIDINPPIHTIVSCVAPRFLITSEDIRHALCQNLNTPMNWLRAMTLMIQSDLQTFIECGPGESLTKINRFIPGVVKSYNISNISRLFRDLEITTKIHMSSIQAIKSICNDLMGETRNHAEAVEG